MRREIHGIIHHLIMSPLVRNIEEAAVALLRHGVIAHSIYLK